MRTTLSYRCFKDSPYRSVKHTSYFDTYDDLFARYRGKEITFVEIGVLHGGSLFMWREFFGSQARIIGIDLNPNAKKWRSEGFEIYIGSQSDRTFWNDFIREVGSIDVLLDDGGHMYAQQIITSEALLSNINDGGMLVVEDVHTSYMIGFGTHKYSFVEYTKNMIDRINYRSGMIDKQVSENRVWSIRIYESIVAFLVNTEAATLKSESVVNDGVGDDAEDFRYHDDRTAKRLGSLAKRFELFGLVPGMKWVIYRVLSWFLSRDSATKRLFR